MVESVKTSPTKQTQENTTPDLLPVVKIVMLLLDSTLPACLSTVHCQIFIQHLLEKLQSVILQYQQGDMVTYVLKHLPPRTTEQTSIHNSKTKYKLLDVQKNIDRIFSIESPNYWIKDLPSLKQT